jgi:hypothetical protein
MINARENLGNSCVVAYHTNCAHHLGKITSWYYCWRLVIYTTLETSWTPEISHQNESIIFFLVKGEKIVHYVLITQLNHIT